MICLFLSSAGKNECPCGRVGKESVAWWHLLRKEVDCWAWVFSWSNVQCPTAISGWSCWAPADCVGLGQHCQVWSTHPLQGLKGAAHSRRAPHLHSWGGVGVLLLGLNLPRAARLSSVCCHFPQAQPNLAFPVLVWYRMRRSSLLGF